MTVLSPGQESPSPVPNSQLDESEDGKNHKKNKRQTHFTNQQLQEL